MWDPQVYLGSPEDVVDVPREEKQAQLAELVVRSRGRAYTVPQGWKRATAVGLVAIAGGAAASEMPAGATVAHTAPAPKAAPAIDEDAPIPYLRLYTDPSGAVWYALGDIREVDFARYVHFTVVGGHTVEGADVHALYVLKTPAPAKEAVIVKPVTAEPTPTTVAPTPVVVAPAAPAPPPTTVPAPVVTPAVVAPTPPPSPPATTPVAPAVVAATPPVAPPVTAVVSVVVTAPPPATPAPVKVVVPKSHAARKASAIAASARRQAAAQARTTALRAAAARRVANAAARAARKHLALEAKLAKEHAAAVHKAAELVAQRQAEAAKKAAIAERVSAARAAEREAKAEKVAAEKRAADLKAAKKAPDIASAIYDYLVGNDVATMTPIAASAVLGNMQTESPGLDPTRIELTPATANLPRSINYQDLPAWVFNNPTIGYGLVQSTPPSKMIDWILSQGGNPNGALWQVKWICAELAGTPLLAQLNAAPTAGAAAEAYEQFFERPASLADRGTRAKQAQQFYSEITPTSIAYPAKRGRNDSVHSKGKPKDPASQKTARPRRHSA